MAICFAVFLIGTIVENNKLKEDIKVYDNNFKALNLENSELKDKIVAYKFDARPSQLNR